MTRVRDNFGLIVRAFFTLAGVIYMILSMSAFHMYSTNKISLWKTSTYLDYNDESMKILLCPIWKGPFLWHFLNDVVWRHAKWDTKLTHYRIILINLLQKWRTIKREIDRITYFIRKDACVKQGPNKTKLPNAVKKFFIV